MNSVLSSFMRERQKHDMKKFGAGTEEREKSTASFNRAHKSGNHTEPD
jgi:hypothetical protein